jgi:WD40 repeat protein
MEEAAKGLDRLNQYEHDLGDGPRRVQHCDIKPANMMLVGGAVLVCDFGLAQVLGDAHVTQSITGSPAYMAPECFETEGTSHNRDQYALAIAYHELRTGLLPFDDESFAAVRQAHSKGRLNLSRLEPKEREVIRRATSVRPKDRYPSSMAMVLSLKHAIIGGDESGAKPMRPRPRLAVLALMALLLAVTSMAWRFITKPDTFQLSFDPADCAVRINGAEQGLLEGNLAVALDDEQRIRIQAWHASGLYEEVDKQFTKEDLRLSGFRVVLPRFALLRFDPPDARVSVEGIERQSVDGTIKLVLEGPRSITITASHPSGTYEDLNRSFTVDEIKRNEHPIRLDRSWRYYLSAAFDHYDVGEFEEACNEYRTAVQRGYDSSIRRVNLMDNVGAIQLATISPSGRWLATFSKNANSAHLWDLTAGNPWAIPNPLSGHDDIINCASFLPDESFLLTAGRDGVLRAWNLRSAGTAVGPATSRQRTHDIVSLVSATDGSWIASADFGGTIRIWSLAEGQFHDTGQVFQQEVEIREVQSDRNGQWLTVLTEDGQLIRWEPASASPDSQPQRLVVPDAEARCGIFTPNGRFFVAGTSDGKLCAWDMTQDRTQPLHVWSAHTDDVESVAITSDGARLVTGGLDNEIKIWDLTDGFGGEPRTLLGHNQLVSALTVEPRGRWAASGSWDKSVRVWDLSTASPGVSRIVLGDLPERIKHVAISPDGHWLVASGTDGAALLWDFRHLLLAEHSR